MVKSDKKDNAAPQSKKRKAPGNGASNSRSGGGIDEFDLLFSEKKKQDQQTKK
eukprot:CAMPEP_0201190452 /NCGR_PEP_ID=MMETSP0851-20130426/140253_1 /ASSEMBLY_ACC=CAM_ASM_000631 /TAXON_ID=183588 /ORGANISM="Pseudo-nitzschia fraudulenta, Strain WWA7" /LENGTH=52 /DNA_ID=CAMNT_0047476457 /DNA_START=75 /DNA_END=230 /DNA_ORIENTATION=+